LWERKRHGSQLRELAACADDVVDEEGLTVFEKTTAEGLGDNAQSDDFEFFSW
jgi:hypothetical protein